MRVPHLIPKLATPRFLKHETSSVDSWGYQSAADDPDLKQNGSMKDFLNGNLYSGLYTSIPSARKKQQKVAKKI